MSEIPEDIRKRAELVYLALGHSNIADERAIARAILAERERAAKIARDDDGRFTDYGEDRNNAIAQATCRRIEAAIRNLESDSR